MRRREAMADRDATWLAVVLAALLATRATLAAAPAAATDADLQEQRETMRGRLLDLGYEPAAAGDAARRLTADDLAVLLGNPAMMQAAGVMDATMEMTLGIALVIGVVVSLAIAGSTVVIIST